MAITFETAPPLAPPRRDTTGVPVSTIVADASRHVAADPRRARITGIDAMRGLAMLGIVWMHSVASRTLHETIDLARYGTPLFSIVAGFFVARAVYRTRSEDLSGFVGRRFRRLYLPFLAWSVIYAIVILIYEQVFQRPRTLTLSWSLLWNGTEWHLWFLPYLFGLSILAIPVVRLAMLGRTWGLAVGSLVVAVAIVMTLLPPPGAMNTAPMDQPLLTRFYFRAPSFMLGLAFGILCAGRVPLVKRWLVTTCLIFAGAVLIAYWAANADNIKSLPPWLAFVMIDTHLFPRLAAVAMAIAGCWHWQGWIADQIGRIGRLSYGVYLTHLLFVLAGLRLTGRLGLSGGMVADVSIFALSVFGSLALTAVLRRSAYTRWLAP